MCDITQHTVKDTKIVGALLAAWLICTTPGSAQLSFTIFTDNQSLVKSLTKCSSGLGSYLINPFHQIINTLQAPLKVIWIPGHSEVLGNKEVDDLVKMAAQGQSSPPLYLPFYYAGPSLTVPMQKNSSIHKRSKQCGQSNGTTH